MDPTARGGRSFRPVGTLDEITPLRLDQTNVATCSPKTANNLGCSYYEKCRFRMIRDGHTFKGAKEPLKGPENIAVYYQLSPAEGGEGTILEMGCYQYYSSGLDDRYKQMEKTGESVKVLGIAGQPGPDGKPKKFKFEQQVKAHAKKNPECDDCLQGKCMQLKRVYDERPISPHPRPRDSFKRFLVGAEIHESAVSEIERSAGEEAFDPEAYEK